jgi:U3 small nucleolar RNA-associated protein 3
MSDIEASSSGSEDLVEATLRQRAAKKQARIEMLAERARAFIPPVQDETDERRDAGYKIMKNKGLTRIRKKEVRNSRVKYRNKFEKAVMRRKGQVQDTIREGPSDGANYAGEETGIRTHLKKSVRLS